MSGLRVDAGDMNRQGMNTISASEDLSNQIGSLKNNVESLMMIWKGLSANQFKDAVDAQVVNLNEFQQVLNLLGEKVVQGARRFDETEQENASRAANLFD